MPNSEELKPKTLAVLSRAASFTSIFMAAGLIRKIGESDGQTLRHLLGIVFLVLFIYIAAVCWEDANAWNQRANEKE